MKNLMASLTFALLLCTLATAQSTITITPNPVYVNGGGVARVHLDANGRTLSEPAYWTYAPCSATTRIGTQGTMTLADASYSDYVYVPLGQRNPVVECWDWTFHSSDGSTGTVRVITAP